MRNRTQGIQKQAQSNWESLSEEDKALKILELQELIASETPAGDPVQYCINNMCTIRISCERFKEYIDIPEEARNNRTLTGHYWQDEDNTCKAWKLRAALNSNGEYRVRWQPKTKHWRRRGGQWS